MNSEQEYDDRENSSISAVGIQFEINAESNATLIRSAKIAERPKKAEAKLRLQDHLKRFPNWKP
jgi:hypothetical protein